MRKNQNKNLCHINATITKQSRYWLNYICAMKGWPERDIGRAIDLLMKTYIRNYELQKEMKGRKENESGTKD